jgi:hypothetical protein
MRFYVAFTLFIVWSSLTAQTFSYSGYIYNSNGSGAVNVAVNLYKRTTPALTGFTSQTNYNGHSYYRSTTTSTWTGAKSACESMGGHLVTMSNAAENTFVFGTWPSGWFGYYQDKSSGYFFSEPSGGWRWTELPVTTSLVANYDIADTSSYKTTSPTLVKNTIKGTNSTLFSTPTYTSTSGKYMSFNGSTQYMMTENLGSYFNSGVVSLMLWCYPTDAGVLVSEQGQTAIDAGWFDSQIEITNVSGSSGTLKCGTWSGSGLQSVSTTITLNRWNFICLTHSGTQLKGYLNGTNFGSLSYVRQYPPQLYYTFASKCNTNMGDGTYANARLGSFQVSNVAWTDDEVNRSYMFNAYRFGIYPYSNWNGGEPNNSGTEDYAQFVSGGKWNDLPNSVSLNYVIEFDYLMNYTPWVLHRTVYTNSSGYYNFSEATNPSVEWYIKVDASTPVSAIQSSDIIASCDVVLNKITRKSLHWILYDVNGDGKITVSDSFYISSRRYGNFTTWVGSATSKLYTVSEYNSLNTGTTDLRTTYPGVSSVTITTPVSGGTSNYYLIAPGYSGNVNY